MNPVEREQIVERVVEPEFDPRFALASLEDSVRSLKTGMILLGLVSLAALALSFYALVQAADDDDRTTTRSGASQSEVSSLEDRLETLEDREAPEADSVERALNDKADAEDVAALEKAIEDLQKQPAQEPAEAEQDPETAQAITDLTQRLDDLEARVEQQEQQAP